MLVDMLTVQDLPAVNATLNACAAVLLVTAYVLIRMRRPVAHRNVMIAALACSALFLTSYLTYHALTGSRHFPGTGTARTVYFAILITHTILAAAVPFLAGITVWRAWRGSFARHKRIARWTLPIWLYVSVTGVVVYWMLYRMTW
jgi:putative membrane protein